MAATSQQCKGGGLGVCWSEGDGHFFSFLFSIIL